MKIIQNIQVKGNILFDKEKTTVICCPFVKGAVVIPSGVKK